MAEKISEKAGQQPVVDDDDHPNEVHSYFARSTKSPNLQGAENEKIPPLMNGGNGEHDGI